MALRTVTINDPAACQSNTPNYPKWESITCKLVTPMHGGGVEARKSDSQMPVRITSIRGQLRFWWRILAEYKWKIPKKELRQKEFKLWGGMSQGDESSGNASLVFLRIQLPDQTLAKNKLNMVSYEDYAPNINSTLGYALFTARSTKTGLLAMKLGQEGFEWTLEWRFDTHISDEQKKQVMETLRWWTTFGALGGRTRRGCGAFEVIPSAQFEAISKSEMEALGCKILYSGSLKNDTQKKTAAILAWEDATQEWKEIRKEHKEKFRKLLGEHDEHSRHLATVFSRPIRNGSQWQGMVIVLPNSSAEVKKILGVSS